MSEEEEEDRIGKALHLDDCGRIVGPTMTAHSMGVSDVKRRAEVAVEGLHHRKGK
jgi:hypothetical protein